MAMSVRTAPDIRASSTASVRPVATTVASPDGRSSSTWTWLSRLIAASFPPVSEVEACVMRQTTASVSSAAPASAARASRRTFVPWPASASSPRRRTAGWRPGARAASASAWAVLGSTSGEAAAAGVKGEGVSGPGARGLPGHIGGSGTVLKCPSDELGRRRQQAPSFCAQKSSNCCVSELDAP
jgi:hypothetical protein